MKGKDAMTEKTITIEIDEQGNSSLDSVSYTHLTLPTNREV